MRGRFGLGRVVGPPVANIYRFTEPILLLLLARLGQSHGYQLANQVGGLAMTGTGIDLAGIYRALRELEMGGYVRSEWDTSGGGPARRLYSLTPAGLQLLDNWAGMIVSLSSSMQEFLAQYRQLKKGSL